MFLLVYHFEINTILILLHLQKWYILQYYYLRLRDFQKNHPFDTVQKRADIKPAPINITKIIAYIVFCFIFIILKYILFFELYYTFSCPILIVNCRGRRPRRPGIKIYIIVPFLWIFINIINNFYIFFFISYNMLVIIPLPHLNIALFIC